jgi:hypothetical protein
LQKVGGLFPKCIVYNVTGFSLPPIITDGHYITEKLFNMAKNSETVNQSINPVGPNKVKQLKIC